jgi:hypothetical protein
MYQSGTLTNIDYISSVSGGGYASAWFFAQQIVWSRTKPGQESELDGFRGKLLSDKELFLEYAECHSRLGNDSALGYWSDISGRYLLSLAWIPFKTIDDLQGNRNPTWLGASYGLSLEKTYLLHPVSTARGKYNFANRRGRFENFGSGLHRSQPISLLDLEKFVRLSGRPIPIFNCTIPMGPRPDKPDPDLKDRVFEISPWQTGAASLGYSSYPGALPADLSVKSAMVLSGAAFDSEAPSITNGLLKWWLRMTGKDLGGDIDNVYSKKPKHLYLSDGGHAENLGILPLIRRGCRTIVVVDAEHEPGPTNKFKSYYQLKAALKSELNLDFVLSGIETNSSDYIYSGNIGPIPILTDDDIFHSLTQQVIYLKLPLNKTHAKNRLPPNIWEQVAIQDYLELKESKRFPQNPTTDQNYSPQRAQAYRALGRAYGDLASKKYQAITADAASVQKEHPDK